jgi:hypothetical protein
MPAIFQIDKQHKLVITTCSGILTAAELFAHQKALRKHPDFDPGYSQFVDLSDVTKLELTGEDINRFAEGTIFSPHSRRAVLAPRDVDYGVARMYAILREFKGEEGIQVFRNRDEAMNWVLAKGTAV